MTDIDSSMIASVGGVIACFFDPLGFGSWKGAVAIISAEMAKEQAIGTLAVLNGVAADAADTTVSAGIASMFTTMGAFSFMVLNLFDPPCVVAMATIRREMGSRKWGWIAIGYQVLMGYVLAFLCYQSGSWLFFGSAFGTGQIISAVLIAVIIYCIVRKPSKAEDDGAKMAVDRL